MFAPPFADTPPGMPVSSSSITSGSTSSSASGSTSSSTSSSTSQGSAATTYSSKGTYSNKTYTSTGNDENAVRIDGAAVTIKNSTISKTAGSSSNSESGDFYGLNAGLLATNGATATLSGLTVNTSVTNGNGVFCYGSGTTVTISNSTITTSGGCSGGIMTTGGGTMNATKLTISTSNSSSAAIRTDRGGGTVTVKKGSYTTSGYNSPAVYSTADISVSKAKLTAKNSEALVIEGQNSIKLTNCTTSGNMSSTQGTSSNENVHTVMIYQSMSGDATVGTSSLVLSGGTLTSNNGDVFYVTNTACTIKLKGTTIVNKGGGNLFTISGNSASKGWGTAGKNGGTATVTCSKQKLKGAIEVDSISKLNLTLADSSEFTGSINIVSNAQNGTAVSNNAVVTIEKGSTWNLTSDCTVTSLTNNGTINYNGYTITCADGSTYTGQTVKKGITYQILSGHAVVSSAKSSLKKLNVPATVKFGGKTYKVEGIGKNALRNSSKLKKVVLGKNIKTIGKQAFASCTSLRSVTIKSKQLASIGSKAFYGCKKLRKVVLKTTKLKSANVGSLAFSGVKAGCSFKVPAKKVAAYKTLIASKGAVRPKVHM